MEAKGNYPQFIYLFINFFIKINKNKIEGGKMARWP
jgi:hypothetical protein